MFWFVNLASLQVSFSSNLNSDEKAVASDTVGDVTSCQNSMIFPSEIQCGFLFLLFGGIKILIMGIIREVESQLW